MTAQRDDDPGTLADGAALVGEARAERAAPYDPARHLITLGSNRGNAQYLEVKFRLLWLRKDHPDAAIETELHRLDEREAIFMARVSIPGGGSATGWGSESAGDFRDFIEKAETKAIGRALAALGFGTQFCDDHSEGVIETATGPTMRIADSPVDFARGKPAAREERDTRTASGYRSGSQGGIAPGEQRASVAAANANDPISAAQERFMRGLVANSGVGLTPDQGQELSELEQMIQQRSSRRTTRWEELTKGEISPLIDDLQRIKQNRKG